MSNECFEYDRDANPYPSSGKKYNGEKAIISLTSWKGRINSVHKTLYSLIKQCPGFHVVLVLSEEEFPQKEESLPEPLMLFVENDLIELLWVYKNYKSFKKVLFTMDKYRNVPVVSADDGCMYIKNFAEHLYDAWLLHQTDIICNMYWHNKVAPGCGGGSGVLYPPNCFGNLGRHCIVTCCNELLKNPNDDRFMANLSKVCKIIIRKTENICPVFIDIDTKHGMGVDGKYIIGSNWKFFDIINGALNHYVST